MRQDQLVSHRIEELVVVQTDNMDEEQKCILQEIREQM